MYEEIIHRLKDAWDEAVRQGIVHIHPLINNIVAEFDQATLNQIGPFLEELNQRSDRRVDLWFAFIAYGPRGRIFEPRVTTVEKVIDEGYASGDTVRQQRLKEFAEICEKLDRIDLKQLWDSLSK